MKKLLLFVTFLTLSAPFMRADEGMWLPSLIGQRIQDMRKNGFRLTAEDVYSVNKASLKDAIVHFGGGCTGEMISGDGLLLTNHHCGYSQIQSHSSVEHDYLTNGFWAMNRSEELPNSGLTVRFLVRMEDVTEAILKGVTDGMDEESRGQLVRTNQEAVVAKAIEGTHYQARVESLFYGNQYFLFVFETYTDVRLVGAPPSAIGKFGGDTDNWMWPRHTGDFALFRVYAGPDNKPAAYSPSNVPYKPKKFFTISLKGVKENDFTMVYGYPGRTQQYIHSQAVNYIQESNPHKIRLRTQRLNIMNEAMAKSPAVRIQYASKNASVANSWKRWQGETKGLIRLQTVAQKRAFEESFTSWAAGKPQYASLVGQLQDLYDELEPYAYAADYHSEALVCVEIVRMAGSISQLLAREERANSEAEQIRSLVSGQLETFFKDYYRPIDQSTFVALLREYLMNVPSRFHSPLIAEQITKYGYSIEMWADELFSTSLFASKEQAMEALHRVDFMDILRKDPAMQLYTAYMDQYNQTVMPKVTALNSAISLLYRGYMRGQMEFQKNKVFYPDANSTLRITYGKVKGYKPMDAVYYEPLSTLDGIMEKDNPDIYDYDVPQKLRDLYHNKDYGRWAVNGTVPVCFIATNHTSGGNSGSPVLNAYGELVGINFDRVWEGTMSDLAYDPVVCRNISVDIRYILFVIDKFAGAGYLLDEMRFSR
ncbi:MAG: S46 family peptidase [Bacteroidales bacterium]|nr:S46 family peptidase [Bacteroidales bacterium]MCL2737892.1 S46 family peptidase [Bacteroidales bacterium]